MATPYPKSKYRDSPLVGHKQPTEKQLAVGNQPKGHLTVHGMRVSIENEAGTTRRGFSEGGKVWATKMQHDYGYLRGTKGKDKEHLDVFLGPDHQNPDLPVHVIDQNNKNGDFDEHKAMVGFPDQTAAIIAYHQNYEPGWDRFRSVASMPPAQFRDWATAGKDRGKQKPAADYAAFKGAEDGKANRGYTDVVQRAQRAGDSGVDQGSQGGVRPGDGYAAGGSVLQARGDSRDHGGPRGSHNSLALGSSADCGCQSCQEAGAVEAGPSGPAGGGTPDVRVHSGDVRANGSRGLQPSVQQRRFAEGGSVWNAGQDSAAADLAGLSGDGPQPSDDLAGRPFIGFPSSGRRPEALNDRAASASAPASLLRGVLAGTAGLPGDLEGLGRLVASAVKDSPFTQTLGKALPGVGLATQALGSSPDTASRLPTTSFFNDWLPGKAAGPVNDAATAVGNLAGLDPLTAARPVKAALEAGSPLVRGALSRAAENLAAPAQLSKQAGAVKLPGGNWFGPGKEQALEDVRGWVPEDQANPVADWMIKRIGKYIQNDLGTAKDPLLQLEKEGRLHLSQEQLQDLPQVRARDPLPLTNNGNAYSIGDDSWDLHNSQTGRPWKTAWETLSDASVNPSSARVALRDSLGRGATPDWLMKMGNQDPGQQIYDVNRGSFHLLGFDHVHDYLDQATDAGKALQFYGSRQAMIDAGGEGRDTNLIARNLHILPEDLPKMSLPDVIRKTADWNDFLAKAKQLQDVNKGVKTVLKQYPDTGHQWVELDPAGLEGEGSAMGHCVGGYCSQVEGGQSRILSLRDKEGQPHVTVELARPDARAWAQTQPWPGDVPDLPDPAAWFGKSSMHDYIQGIRNGNGDYDEVANQMMQKYGGDMPWTIKQIKGKGNKAPVAEYLPAVQDLVRNMGPWGDQIGDLGNTGLRRTRDAFNQQELDALKAQSIDLGSYTTNREVMEHQIKLGMPEAEARKLYNIPPGFAQGGHVKGGRRYLDDGGSAGGDGGDGGDGGASAGDPGTGDPGASGVAPGDVGTSAGGPGPGDAGGSASGPGGTGSSAAGQGDPGVGDPGVSGVAQGDIGTSAPATSSASSGNGIAGLMGIDNSNLASMINGIIGVAASTMGAPPGIVGMTNAAINSNPSQAASTMGGIIGSIAAGPIGGIAGSAIGSAIGSAPGVPAGSVPGDPTGGGSWAIPESPQNLSSYYQNRSRSAMPAQASIMAANPQGWTQGGQNGWGLARGGSVRGPLSRISNRRLNG